MAEPAIQEQGQVPDNVTAMPGAEPGVDLSRRRRLPGTNHRPALPERLETFNNGSIIASRSRTNRRSMGQSPSGTIPSSACRP